MTGWSAHISWAAAAALLVLAGACGSEEDDTAGSGGSAGAAAYPACEQACTIAASLGCNENDYERCVGWCAYDLSTADCVDVTEPWWECMAGQPAAAWECGTDDNRVVRSGNDTCGAEWDAYVACVE